MTRPTQSALVAVLGALLLHGCEETSMEQTPITHYAGQAYRAEASAVSDAGEVGAMAEMLAGELARLHSDLDQAQHALTIQIDATASQQDALALCLQECPELLDELTR